MNRILLMIVVVASGALSARAQNLVVNPGFETGDFTGWTQWGDTSATGVTSGFQHSGSFAAYFGPVFSDGGIDQTIATTVGQVYNVSFWLDNRDTLANNRFSASFAGVTILSLTNSGPFSYTQYSMDITATSSSSLLHFSTYNPPSYWDLDDVDVHAVVPEPGTLGLIALGALGLVGAVRKRRLV